jgi:hypothetical protein
MELKMELTTGWSRTLGDPTGAMAVPLRSFVEPMSAVLENTAMQLSARRLVELPLILQSLLHQPQSQLNKNVIFPSTGQVSQELTLSHGMVCFSATYKGRLENARSCFLNYFASFH